MRSLPDGSRAREIARRAVTLGCTALLLMEVLAAGQSRAAEVEAPKAEASIRFGKGVELFKSGDYLGALAEFKAAYETEPHYKTLYNIGITLKELHRYKQAKIELETYLALGADEIPAARRKEVVEILDQISSYIGTLELVGAVPGAVVLVDGVQVATFPLGGPIDLDVGEHTLEVRAKGFETFADKLSVAGGKRILVELDLRPASTKGLGAGVKKESLKRAGGGLFIAGTMLGALTLLAIPVTAAMYLVDAKVMRSYAVPAVGLGSVAALGVLVGADAMAASGLSAMGIPRGKTEKGLYLASWILWGLDLAAVGLHWVVSGLYVRYDDELRSCTIDCTQEKNLRDGFYAGNWLMALALTGLGAASLAVGVAAWVLLRRQIEAGLALEDEGQSAMRGPVMVVPWVSPVERGFVAGLSLSF